MQTDKKSQRVNVVIKKIICILAAAIVCCSGFALPVFAADAAIDELRVAEVNIDISAQDYKTLISSPEKIRFDVSVSRDGSEAVPSRINIRGSSSKQLGLLTKAKRIPFELKFESSDDFGTKLKNKDVKFINSFTIYRLIAEYLALDLFEYAGIPTPAHEIVFVQFNGVDFGLYLAVEDVDSRFLKKWYGEDLGSSYKATNKDDADKQYIDSEWFGRIYEKEENGSQILQPLMDALEKGEGYEQYIDIDQWLRYFACVAAIGGDASIFSEQNNFVLYDDGGRFDLMPWDQSEAFSGRTTPNGIDKYYIGDDLDEPSPLFELLMADPERREQYHDNIRELCEGFLKPEILNERYSAVLDAIEPYLARDHSIGQNKKGAADLFRAEGPEGLYNLRYELRGHYENLIGQLNGTESAFFVNPSYAEIFGYQDFESLITFIESNTPMYDRRLPKKIVSAAYGKTGLAHPVFAICLFSAAVIACIFAVAMIKRRRSGAAFRAIFIDHRYAFIIFAFLAVYSFVVSGGCGIWRVDEVAYSYHALDYGMGFCSGFLVGAIYKLLGMPYDYAVMSVYETALTLFLFLAVSFFCEAFIKNTDEKDRPTAVRLLLFFLTGTGTLSLAVMLLGVYDVYWMYFGALFLLFMSKKQLMPLVVPVIALSVMVHYGGVVAYVPMFLILILYRLCIAEKRSDKVLTGIVFALSVAVALGLELYFLINDRANTTMSLEEFGSVIDSRNITETTRLEWYYYHMVRNPDDFDTQFVSELYADRGGGFFGFMLQMFMQQLTITLDASHFLNSLPTIVVLLPMFALMFGFIFHMVKQTGSKLKKLTLLLCPLLFVYTLALGFCMSTDVARWIDHAYMCCFVIVLYVAYHERGAALEYFKNAFARIPAGFTVPYYLIYALSAFHPFR